MEDSSPKTSKIDRNIALFFIAATFLVSVLFYCAYQSSPRITVDENLPLTFHISGKNKFHLLSLEDSDGKEIWKLYPKRSDGLSLRELGTIKFGEVPPFCEQGFPKDFLPPQQLIDGKRYFASVPIFEGNTISVSFIIKDGKVIDIDERY